MTLAGSVWHKPGAAGGPGRPSLMDTVLPSPGFWGQREADGGGCRMGVLTGPKGTPGFSYTASVKRSTFCVLWRQPLQTCCLCGKPVCKFTQHFQSVYVLVLVIIYSINTVIE